MGIDRWTDGWIEMDRRGWTEKGGQQALHRGGQVDRDGWMDGWRDGWVDGLFAADARAGPGLMRTHADVIVRRRQGGPMPKHLKGASPWGPQQNLKAAPSQATRLTAPHSCPAVAKQALDS